MSYCSKHGRSAGNSIIDVEWADFNQCYSSIINSWGKKSGFQPEPAFWTEQITQVLSSLDHLNIQFT